MVVVRQILDEGIVLHHSGMDGLVFLDAFASYCFCVAEKCKSDAEVIAAVQSDMAGLVDRKEEARNLLCLWRQLGLLPYESSSASTEVSARHVRLSRVCAPIVLRGEEPDQASIFRILGRTYRVACSIPDLLAEVDAAFAHLRSQRPIRRPVKGFSFRLDPSGDETVLTGHGREWWRGHGLAAVPALKSTVFSIAVDATPYLASVHAAGVGRGDRCVLLAGGSGSGKSLLTLALLKQGCFLLSDDCVLLDRRLSAIGVPMPISIKRSGLQIADEMEVAVGSMSEHIRYDGQSVKYWAPWGMSERRGIPVHAICFVKYQQQEPDRGETLSTYAGLKHLTELMQIRRPMRQAELSMLIDWAKAVRFFDLRFSSHKFATAAVTALLE